MSKARISFAVGCVCLSLLLMGGMASAAPNVLTHPIVGQVIHFDVSPPLRDLVKMAPNLPQYGLHLASPALRPKMQNMNQSEKLGYANVHDAALQNAVMNPLLPTVGVNVLGVGVGFFGYQVPDAPTDVNLAVGDTQVVQWVNVSFAVFDKATGNNILFNGQHSVLGSQLWAGFNGQCANSNSGDIIAQWDKVAHRWVLMQPRFSPPYRDCFAISMTPDATGSYFRFEFATPNPNVDFPDYPKLGIWRDGYYIAHNDFPNLQSYAGVMACAYERAKLLVGDNSAKQICFIDNSNGTLFDDSMLPADIDSPEALPPVGMPEIFVGSIDNFPNGDSHVYEYLFHADFVNPNNSTFTGVNGAMPINVTAYRNAPGTAPEPGGSVIDTLSDRLMYRFAYRRTPFAANGHASYLVNHAVVAGNSIGERWYEFRAPNPNSTALAVFQQGTYAPDATARFMGSLAMDKQGNIAMGYTTSSSTIFPTISYTGRVPGDPLGTMESEGTIFAGTGSQTDTVNRWGDYTSMAIDNDGCTFWYTNQYYVQTGSFSWSTRVASLKFPGCN
ncbi:MAG TPA: hypothetical protein VJ756_03580 [Terriglobales bacterium]|nr:hypothetical protein [Terriglobales bacterium]